MQTTSGTQNYSTPRIDMIWVEQHTREQMPTPVLSVIFRLCHICHVLLKIVKRKTTYCTCSVRA